MVRAVKLDERGKMSFDIGGSGEVWKGRVTSAAARIVRSGIKRGEKVDDMGSMIGSVNSGTGGEVRVGHIRFDGVSLKEDVSWGWSSLLRAGSALAKGLPGYGEILSFGRVQGFPTKRRPEKRPMSTETDDVVETWFWSTGIRIGEVADTDDKQRRFMRMLYTWRECFTRDLRDIKATDLVEHAIELLPAAKPYKAKVPLWTKSERDYAKVLFPDMVAAGIVVMCDGPWGHRTRFIAKLHGSKELRTIHNFIPVNRWTVPSAFPTPRVEQIVDTLVKAKFSVFSGVDATSSYWAIPLRAGDELKTGFICPEGQFAYRRMGMGLKNGTHTYARFRQIVFGHIPEGDGFESQSSLVGDHGSWAFDGMVDDSFCAAVDFEEEIRAWHEEIFPRIAFGPIYLKGSKCAFSMKSLDMTGLEGSNRGLRPSEEKRNKFANWPVPNCKADVEAFAYLTPFLRRFIPGRAEHVRVMKMAYTNADGSERDGFEWGEEQEYSFRWIQRSVVENACCGSDDELQYHLASDASKTGTGGVLFQLPGVAAGVTAGSAHKDAMRIVMWMSFRLSATESKYSTQEREGLAMMRNLDECAWLVKGLRWPVKCYTDHFSLVSIMQTNTKDAHGRLARWQDRLTEYDYEVIHKPGVDHFMKLADGLSRLPPEYASEFRGDLSDRLTLCLGATRITKKKGKNMLIERVRKELERGIGDRSEGVTEDDVRKYGKIQRIKINVGKTEEVRYKVDGEGEDKIRGKFGKSDGLDTVMSGTESEGDSGGVLLSGSEPVDDAAIREEKEEQEGRGSGEVTGAMDSVHKEGGSVESVGGAVIEDVVVDKRILKEDRTPMGRGYQSRPTMEDDSPDYVIDRNDLVDDIELFEKSEWYGDIVKYVRRGMEGLKSSGLGRNGTRAVVRRSIRFLVLGEGLFWKERDGCLAKCVLPHEVDGVLMDLHDCHGHFAGGLTVGRAIGRYYWPLREKDIWRYCLSCDTCQRVGPRRKSGLLQPILQFRPFDMVGMDYVGPITPACTITGARYVLLVVDYFSRFVFARAFAEATQLTTLSMFFESIVPIFGWPMSVYCDNGSHFMGNKVQDTFQAFGVTLIAAPISHPSSVGLSERYVQMLVGALRRHCIAKGSMDDWGMQIGAAVMALNTRRVRVHGHTPSEILLGFNGRVAWPAIRMREGRVQTVGKEIGEMTFDTNTTGVEAWNVEELLATRDYRGDDMIMKKIAEQERAMRSHDGAVRWEPPKPGDLVMIRRHEIDTQRGKKLESRWEGPRLLVRLSERSNSGFVRELHGKEKEKRYHVDDMRVYVSRADSTLMTEGAIGVTYEGGLAEEGARLFVGGEKREVKWDIEGSGGEREA